MTNTAVAHVITAEATALGDPEVIVMTPAEPGDSGGEELDRVKVPAHLSTDPEEVEIGLRMFGWQVTGERTLVEPGYYLVGVEKIPARDD